MTVITSSQNPVIKEIRAMKLKKHRDAAGRFFIEGVRFVREALQEQVSIERVLVSAQLAGVRGGTELMADMEAQGLELYSVDDKIFREISDTETPQGVLAVLKKQCYSLEQLADATFLVVLEDIQDPGNLGTLIRTADAAGASGVLLSRGCADLYNPKVLRSTMGSLFHIPIVTGLDLLQAVPLLQKAGVQFLAAHLDGQVPYFHVDMQGKTAILIGNEANGLSTEISGLADTLVRIPMPGRAESLNASVAGAVLIYELVRQRLTHERDTEL